MRFHVLGLPHTVSNKEYVACYSNDTQIMTEDGWRDIKHLAENNVHIRVATLNRDTDQVEYQYPSEWIVNNYEGKMFHQKGTSLDFLVTPEHRAWCRSAAGKRKNGSWSLIECQKANKQVQHRRDFPWAGGEYVEFFELPEHLDGNKNVRPAKNFKMDDWLCLFGIYIAEGHVDGTSYKTKNGLTKGSHVVSIAQENQYGRVIIHGWLEKMGIKVSVDDKRFVICDVQFANWFKQFGKAREKYIPKEFKNLDKKQLSILLEALVLGDGWIDGCTRRYVSYSKTLADDVSEIALKLGYAVTQYADPNPEAPRHIVTMSHNCKQPMVNQSKDFRSYVDYKGYVYCLRVPNEIVYIRRNGKSCFSGNCAYTQKVVKFCKMMKGYGHHIIHYGHEDSDTMADEQVTVIGNKDLEIAYGNYDWRKNFFKFDVNDHAYQTFYKNAIREVGIRKQPNDFILPFWGHGVRPVCDAHKDLIVVEPGIGYSGGMWADFKVFESYALLHAHGGLDSVGNCSPKWYDVVIPNYFDLEDFEYREKKSDYFLYLGRVYDGKGVHIAVQAAQAAGVKLVVAGQKEDGYVLPSEVEYLGYADVALRKELMAGARASFLPSIYNEPFGGVQIENLLSGTPTITNDWGAFVENNLHGITGYRCRTMGDYVNAIHNIDKISPKVCRQWAEDNFSLERISRMYNKFFTDVYNVHTGKGWYAETPETTLEAMVRYYPGSLESQPLKIGDSNNWWQENIGSNHKIDGQTAPDMEEFALWMGDSQAEDRKMVRNLMYQYAPYSNHNKLLDVGCGACPEYYGIEEDYPQRFHYTGIDLTQKMVDNAISKNIDVRLSSAENICFEDDSFHIVHCRHVLEHLSDFKLALSELIRVARNAVFVSFFIEPNDSPHTLYDYAPYGDSQISIYNNCYSKMAIEKYLKSNSKIYDWSWKKMPDSTHSREVLIIVIKKKALRRSQE